MTLDKNLFFLYGNDLNSISKRIKEISNEITGLDNKQITIEEVELSNLGNIEDFIHQGSNMPIFFNTSILKLFLSIKIKIDDVLITQFIDLLKSISIYKIVILVLYIERYDKNIQKTLLANEFFNSLSKIISSEQHIKLMFWQRDKIEEKVNQLANKYNLKFQTDSLNLFIDCIKEDLSNIEIELQKLQTYLLPGNIVTEKIVQDFYFNSSSLNDLYNMLLVKEKNDLLFKIGNLKNPLYVIASLQNKLRQALELKTYFELGKNNYEISKIAGIHSYKIEKELQQLKHLSSSEIKGIVEELSNIEFKVKNGIIKDENALDMILIRS